MTSAIATVFAGTLIVFALCGLALGLGALLGGAPLAGGCGRDTGVGCEACPNRHRSERCRRERVREET